MSTPEVAIVSMVAMLALAVLGMRKKDDQQGRADQTEEPQGPHNKPLGPTVAKKKPRKKKTSAKIVAKPTESVSPPTPTSNDGVPKLGY